LKLPTGVANGKVMVAPAVLMAAVVVVCPPWSGETTRSTLAEVGLTGAGQGLQPGAGLFAITKRLTGMLNVTWVFGGNKTVPGLDFAMTMDLRHVVVVTVQIEPLLPEQAKLSGSGTVKRATAIKPTTAQTF
jgi:hypothetical protein